MRIGIDIRVLMDDNYSGVSKYADNLIKALLKKENNDNKLDAISNQYHFFYNSWANIAHKFTRFSKQGVEIKSLSIPNKIFNYFCQKLFKNPKIDLLLKEPDILFFPHINFISFSKNTKTKKVITVHDLSFMRHPEYFSIRKNFWHKALSVKKLLQSFDLIIAVSESTKNDIIELCDVSEDRIRVIYSGTEEMGLLDQSFESLRADFFNSRKMNCCLGKKYLLYLGTIEPRKNIINIVKSYNHLRDNNKDYNYPLVLAGGKGWKTKSIYKEIRRSKYKNDIILTGYVSDKQREYLLSSAYIFLYPSLYEGFGFPPLEAMSFSVPVITSNISSMPEVVADSALLINPNDYLEISHAISSLLESKELQNLLIERGKNMIGQFNWDKTANEYLEAFNDVIKK